MSAEKYRSMARMGVVDLERSKRMGLWLDDLDCENGCRLGSDRTMEVVSFCACASKTYLLYYRCPACSKTGRKLRMKGISYETCEEDAIVENVCATALYPGYAFSQKLRVVFQRGSMKETGAKEARGCHIFMNPDVERSVRLRFSGGRVFLKDGTSLPYNHSGLEGIMDACEYDAEDAEDARVFPVTEEEWREEERRYIGEVISHPLTGNVHNQHYFLRHLSGRFCGTVDVACRYLSYTALEMVFPSSLGFSFYTGDIHVSLTGGVYSSQRDTLRFRLVSRAQELRRLHRDGSRPRHRRSSKKFRFLKTHGGTRRTQEDAREVDESRRAHAKREEGSSQEETYRGATTLSKEA